VTVEEHGLYTARLRQQYGDAHNLNARIELHRRFSTNSYGWTLWVFDQLQLAPDAHVLELGCGTGLLWKVNAGRVGASCRITLADLSFGMLREARLNLRGLGLWVSYAQADAHVLPFEDETFDMVLANHMLYHVEDRERAISEIQRVITPHGAFYAATNGAAHLRELDQIIGRFMGGASTLGQNAERFGLETGESQLRRHFGRVELRRYEDSLIVTEAQPLVDYAQSSMRGMTKEALAAMRAYVEDQLDHRGSIHISKDAGIFFARR
jgi:SAM-dependent methyltransferase